MIFKMGLLERIIGKFKSIMFSSLIDIARRYRCFWLVEPYFGGLSCISDVSVGIGDINSCAYWRTDSTSVPF